MSIAFFDNNRVGEANIGSFASYELNDGWRFVDAPKYETFSLPRAVSRDEAGENNEVVIVNTIPDYVQDGMHLMARSSMEDVLIYVDGELRSEYSSDSSPILSHYIPSAYVLAPLYDKDAGKEISILIRFKTGMVINEISLGHGNNTWFAVINKALWVNFITAAVLMTGTIMYLAALFLRRYFKVSAARYLGLLNVNVSLWIISESLLRQLFFRRPSLSEYFSYFLCELIGAIACMFFDEVQHRVYHKRYLLAESIVLLQILVNIVLYATGLVELYNSMWISHAWLLVCALVGLINIANDFLTKRVLKYHITMLGMILFIFFSLIELIGFYINKYHVFGTEISIALLVLMACTVIQTFYDEYKKYEQRAKSQTLMTITTIETIAGAIDAKDEYTGGHSERVGIYAERLAREIAGDYGLTEEDVLRIHYIGLVHDIGKIGVADNVLNKSGRLTDEEYTLMKQHTEIGYEMMTSLGEGIKDLLAGIRHHHERYDGKGYPDRLSGTDIPLVARILALADSYDAMTSNRVYRLRLGSVEARNEIERCAGAQFDPALAEIFVNLIDKGEIIPHTMEGSAVDKDGRLRNSAILEKRLVTDLMEDVEVIDPSHVRMLCYVMKLMERKGMDYDIVFVETESDMEDLRKTIKEKAGIHDVTILYTKERYIVALFDRDEEETNEFIKTLKSAYPKAKIETLAVT